MFTGRLLRSERQGPGSERMVTKFEELVLVAALVVGLIATVWSVLAMAALQ
jgi:hypothetical protein